MQFSSPIFNRPVLETLVERIPSTSPNKIKVASGGRNLSVGDIVLLVDDTCSRNAWPLARIIETLSNSDGCVRRVKVKTKGGVLMRSINKCVLLEADQEKTQ